jgi:hypothetical protein
MDMDIAGGVLHQSLATPLTTEEVAAMRIVPR